MTHEERLKLIAKPFPPIGGKPGQRVMAYPWAGTIVSDRWFEGWGPDAVRERDKLAAQADIDVEIFILAEAGDGILL